MYVSAGSVYIESGAVVSNLAGTDVNGGFGGGMYIQGGNVSALGAEVGNNVSEGHGGGAYIMGGTLDLTEVAFYLNSAKDGGSKITRKVSDPGPPIQPSISLTDCTGIIPADIENLP